MRRLVAAVLAGAMVLSACSGGDDDTKSSLPLPDQAPSARGPASGPALEAKVLLAAADDLESGLGDLSNAHVERRTGAFISGKTAVGYSVDDISGYDLSSGEKRWTAKLDLGGGTVCFVSQPTGAVKQFTVVHGEGGFCSDTATIRVADGKVVARTAMTDATATLDGKDVVGSSVSQLFTVKKRDYLVDSHGVVWTPAKKAGGFEAVRRLEDSSYFYLLPTPDGKRLIGSRLGSSPSCYVDAYALPSFEHLWTKDNAELFPATDADCTISMAQGSPTWLSQQDGTRQYIVQIDPKTGDVLGRAEGDRTSDQRAPDDRFDPVSAALYFDTTLGLSDGDIIVAQPAGISRYSLADDKMAWRLDLSQLELDSDQDYPTTTVLPQGLTKDGYLVATVSNDTAVDLVAVQVNTGKLVGRWPVPAEYRNGFQVQPRLTLFDDGVVLSRNFQAWNYAFEGSSDTQAPDGDRFDLGVFTFPDPNVKRSGVPTAGPVDTEASWRGGLASSDTDAGESLDGTRVGNQLIVSRGTTFLGLDTRSGKKRWTAQLPDGAQTCSRSELDGKSTVLTVVYKTGGDAAKCRSLVRIGLKRGTMGEVVEAPDGSAPFVRVTTYRGRDYVVSDDGRVDRVGPDGLQRVGHVEGSYERWARTPEDPAVVIGAAELKDGRDWRIDAYRLPGFEKIWSTTASKVISGADARNPLDLWSVNGLWLSTSFGDTTDPDAEVDEVMVHLDTDTGAVRSTTGRVRRDYLVDDVDTLSITFATTSAWFGAGLSDGSVIVSQPKTIMRYGPDDDTIVWSTDVSSIRNSMERERADQNVLEEYELIDGGKTVLVTFSNGTSVEFLTLSAAKGTITGRWKVPVKHRNGLQASPGSVALKGGVALLHSNYGWESEFGADTGREPPSTQRYDVGLFTLEPVKGKD